MADHENKAPHATAAEVDNTTGHEWDGIRELNTPLPRWWLWVFYATHVWALAYIILYPSIPLIRGATPGLLGWNSRAAVEEKVAEANEARAGILGQIRDLPLQQIAGNGELRDAAFRGGQSAFKVNCVQCHGADAAGGVGYANLNDDSWLWGGTLDDIHTTIQHGIRYAADAETRISDMPAFGADGMLTRAEIADTTQFVLSLSGSEHDADAAARGAPLYADNCAACHGERGEGSRELGAPQLNDAIWLYAGTPQAISAQIFRPRQGVMPAWGHRLDPVTVKELTIYVHGLGGGETATATAQN